jgi:UDP-glucuronate 4-epimerase
MTVLVTGAAGFIGYHVSRTLLEQGRKVIGIDNLSAYYDVALKEARLARLELDGFSFERLDIADGSAMSRLLDRQGGTIEGVVHLAAQAGVRYSIENPLAYGEANLIGHLNVLELCRAMPNLRHLVYASSSSVYGGGTELPFTVGQPVDTPISLYAATKRADELMSHSYSHLYRLPATGLRFFTAYGPWGRPDMAAYKFVRAIYAGEPIEVFNNGDMKRDFTYIDDVVAGVVAVLDGPPDASGNAAPHRVYNIGNHRTESLTRYIELIEQAVGRKAEIRFLPMQPGDIKETFADIGPIQEDFGFTPMTTIEQGIPRFVDWYREYHGV